VTGDRKGLEVSSARLGASVGVDAYRNVLELAPDPAAARAAREFVSEQCRSSGVDTEVVHTALLLVSEVVTNAILHGRSGPRLLLTIGPAVMRVEVTDDNSRVPQMVEADADALDGRGLTIVDTLASAWGSRPDGAGKLVWFELEVHAEGAVAQAG
jgi:anti-sigma regulatory factor (Ser/Thr protein kinase)